MRRSVVILVGGVVVLAPAGATAQDAQKDAKTDATEQVEEKEDSGVHGSVDFGWRTFLERAPHQNRAKFEEYGEVKPGPVLENFNLTAESKTTDWVVELNARNAGYNNQFYGAQLYQPGKQYLSATWDQIPHLYSTSAQTLFDNSTPNVLTVPSSVKQQLQTATAAFPNDTATVNAVLKANLRQVDVGVQRDVGRFSYRWTPAPDWDFRIDYRNETKNGTKLMSSAIVGYNAIELLEPVNYRTQNIGASAQYIADLAPGKRWSFNFSYAGSLFENRYKTLTWDNPFLDTPPFAVPGFVPATVARNALPPDNYAHRFSVDAALDLPDNSRLTSTVSYSQMRQNDAFMPMTINALVASSPLPATSLNGAVDTLLVNEVLTRKFNNELTGTLRYRYYDNNNRTPILTFQDFVQLDTQLISVIRRNLAPQYTKENASADLIWKPMGNLTIGATPAWERYDRDRRDADVTNEFSGKVFMDTAPVDWINVRSSYLKAMRRYQHYDNQDFVAMIGDPNEAFLWQNIYMRKFDLADRDRTKAEVSAEIRPLDSVAFTPTLGWRDDRYSDTQIFGGMLGLKRDNAWSAGAELSYTVSRGTSFSAGYMLEHTKRSMINNSAGALAGAFGTDPTADNWGSTITDRIQTVFATANINLIPKQWDLKFRYTFSLASSKTSTYALGIDNQTSDPQFPGVVNRYHRAEAFTQYVLDPDLVKQMGWKGDEVSLRLQYVLEKNSISDWHWDEMLPYMVSMDPTANRSLFLAAINPNYLAQFVVVSLGFKW